MRRLMIVGLVLTVVGILLVVGYWPLTSVSAAELRTAQSGNGYSGYAIGTRITIHAKVLNVSYANFFGSPLTRLGLDSGDPNATLSVFVQGDARAAATPGEVVYMSAVLEQTVFSIEFWQVSTPSDIHAAWPIDAVFYGLTGLGLVMVAVGVLGKRGGRPEG